MKKSSKICHIQKRFFDTENAVKQRYTVLLARILIPICICYNPAYLDAAGELLPQQIYEEGEKNHIRISYKKEILYGEEITGVYISMNRHVVSLTDTNKGVRAIVELLVNISIISIEPFIVPNSQFTKVCLNLYNIIQCEKRGRGLYLKCQILILPRKRLQWQ